MNNHILIFPLITILALGCEGKQGLSGPAGPVGPPLTGDIVGYSSIFDTTALRKNNAGVSIRLEGTNYSTYSDSSGSWKLTGVKTGTYVITASMEGFSIHKNTSFQFVGGDQPAFGGKFYVYKLPTIYVKQIELVGIFTHFIQIKGSLSAKNTAWAFRLKNFVTRDSISKNLTSGNTHGIFDQEIFADTFSVQIDINYLKYDGVDKGSKIYLVSFLSANTGYQDILKNEYVYSGLSPTPSNIIELVIP